MVAEPWQVEKARELPDGKVLAFPVLRYSVHRYGDTYLVMPHEPKRVEGEPYTHLGWVFPDAGELEAFMLGRECRYISMSTRDI